MDKGSVTTLMTMKYGMFQMGGYDTTVLGYRRTFRKGEPHLEESR